VIAAMQGMNATGQIIVPRGGDIAAYHQRKHQVFQSMYHDQQAYRALMTL
jgi:hypothetical protein